MKYIVIIVLSLGIVTGSLYAQSKYKVSTVEVGKNVVEYGRPVFFQSRGIPHEINYQGWLGTDDTTAVTDTLSMIFRLHTALTGGALLWTETQNNVAVNRGIFNVILGSVNPIPDSAFTGEPPYLGINVDGENLSPRKKMVSVGYAIRSERANYADTADYALKPDTVLHAVHATRADTANYATAGADNDWSITGNRLYPYGSYGLAMRGYNQLNGTADSTHVCFGVACTTGTSGQDYKYCAVGGGYRNKAHGKMSTVAGGQDNNANCTGATIGGGASNTATYNPPTSDYGYTTVAGGLNNMAYGTCATVGGGNLNYACESFSTVSGGLADTALNWSTVCGGCDNFAGGGSFVGGGFSNRADESSVVGGGTGNRAGGASGMFGTIGGGEANEASGEFYSTVGGGGVNIASGDAATISGGATNIASGYASTVCGGEADSAGGMYSLAAGYGVKIRGDYTFGFGNSFTTSTANAVIFYHTGQVTRVGINLTNPAYALDLPNLTSASGQARANAWNVYSSRRWKTNIEPISDALDKVRKLRGVYFDWKESGKHDIGMIAEEVGEIIPEVVNYEENGIDAEAMDYSRLVALLIEAIKEQQKEIDLLKAEIERMK